MFLKDCIFKNSIFFLYVDLKKATTVHCGYKTNFCSFLLYIRWKTWINRAYTWWSCFKLLFIKETNCLIYVKSNLIIAMMPYLGEICFSKPCLNLITKVESAIWCLSLTAKVGRLVIPELSESFEHFIQE